MSHIEIGYEGDRFTVTCPSWDKRPSERLAAKWNRTERRWEFDPSSYNIHMLVEVYASRYYTAVAKARVLEDKATEGPKAQFPEDFTFKNPPMEKQWLALHAAWANKTTALFMEMGTGKSFCSINTMVARYIAGQMNAIIIVCPTAVKPVWEIEFEAHCPIEYELHTIESGGKKATERFMDERNGIMKVLVVGIEALSQGGAYDLVKRFTAAYECGIILDESSTIKNATAGRTKKADLLGSECVYKMILNGTPITQGMEDLYAQYHFLDWRVLGQKSFFTFKNRYCMMGGFEGRKIIGYLNQDELLDRVSPYTVLIKKSEMMDLPPKVFEPMILEPSTAQGKALRELGDPFQMATVMDDKTLEVETILERMTRYQQIVGGHFPFKEDGEQHIMRIEGPNPKMQAMMAQLEVLPNDAKVIIWARFIPEVEWIHEELEAAYPGQTLLYYGATKDDDRKRALTLFQDPDGPRFFVSNPAMGGMGLTLTAASYTFYYSNTFSLRDRLQSEDRNHRKGQVNKVTYVDFMLNHDIDKAMVNALRHKKSIADFVTDELEARR